MRHQQHDNEKYLHNIHYEEAGCYYCKDKQSLQGFFMAGRSLKHDSYGYHCENVQCLRIRTLTKAIQETINDQKIIKDVLPNEDDQKAETELVWF